MYFTDTVYTPNNLLELSKAALASQRNHALLNRDVAER